MADEQTTYAGATIVGKESEPHLGGNVKEGDPYTFCPQVWSYVIERFGIDSVLDLGSGVGNAGAACARSQSTDWSRMCACRSFPPCVTT
jgi:hypothetical protein